MGTLQYEVLSNQTVALCGAAYFVALLLNIAWWAATRREDQSAPERAAVMSGARVAGGPVQSSDKATTGIAPPPGVTGRRLERLGLVASAVACLVHFVAVLTRALANDPVRVPWGNMYEFTLTSSFVAVLGFLVLYRRHQLSWLAPVVNAFALVTLMVNVLFLYEVPVSLQDSLQSPWLVIHVIAAVIATGAFTLGSMCSVLYLMKSRWLSRVQKGDAEPTGYLARVPDLTTLDRIAYRLHAFGFPVWTFAALISGPIWAYYAWGRYWGWDPKEVWAFITWVVYACYLHARATAGWKGRNSAVIALVGLATLLFNFIGINFFFGSGSQHSYAAPEPTAVVLRLDG